MEQEKTNAAPEQEAREQQPEQTGEHAKENSEKLQHTIIHRLKIKKCLEVVWWLCLSGTAVFVVAYLVCGQWLRAANNAIWFFIGFMGWRQQHAMIGAAETIIELLDEKCTLLNINSLLKKMVANYEKMVKNYEAITENQAKQIDLLEKKPETKKG